MNFWKVNDMQKKNDSKDKKDKEVRRNKVGRPQIIGKAYYYKADEDLVPVLDNISNRNRYINDAVRKKAKRDRLL